MKNVEPFDYQLPDGNILTIKDQRIKCTETFFHDENIGKEIVFEIENFGNKFRIDFYRSILIFGKNSMIKGFPERLEKEIKIFAPENMEEEIKVKACPEREFGVWHGGSILSSFSAMDSKWFTKTKYEEMKMGQKF